jgi:hypothetical protein
MSAIGTKRTFHCRQSMSAFGVRADINIQKRHACEWSAKPQCFAAAVQQWTLSATDFVTLLRVQAREGLFAKIIS